MLAWEHSGFSIDASVRISFSVPKVRAYCKPLEHLVRYCARPAFALERLTVQSSARDGDGNRERRLAPSPCGRGPG